MENNYKQHWENVFLTKEENELSWFQPYPKTSMEFVEQLNLPKESKIIDIGGGDSHFVDALLEKGYRNLTVLDISANAIARARKRLGDRAELVKWITSDIVDFEPAEQYDL
jgi:ubiquinone/menaquinone biosynthesis C-methylase UbiE